MSNPLKIHFSLRLLLLAVLFAGIASAYLAWALKPIPVVSSADGIDGGEFFLVRGPIVIQHPHRPAVAFISLEHSKFGMGSQVPFLVVFINENPDHLNIEPQSYLHQGAAIVTEISLELKQGELEVSYSIDGYPFDGSPSWYSDGTPAPPFEEEIRIFLPELPGDKPLEFDLEEGRVFVVTIEHKKNVVRQLDLRLFTPAEISNLEPNDLAEFVFHWWRTAGG